MERNYIEEASMKASTCWLTAAEDCFFRPGSGDPWEEKKSFTKEEILNSQTTVFTTRFFKITVSEKSPDFLKGHIFFDDSYGLRIDAGNFILDSEHPIHRTEYLNVAYDTNLRLTLELSAASDVSNKET